MIEGEVLDVVDKFDRVIGKSTRSEIHQLGLLHRSVHLLVFDDSGRLLLQKRSMNKDEAPGRWCSSVAGHLDSGESYDDCVVREAEEEIGLKLHVAPEKMFKVEASYKTQNEFTWAYRVTANGPFSYDTSEVSELRWFPVNELEQKIQESVFDFSSSFQVIFHLLMSLNREG